MKTLGVDVSVGRTSDSAAAIWSHDAVSDPPMATLEDVLVESFTSTLDVADWAVELDEEHDFDSIGVDGSGLGRGTVDALMRSRIAYKTDIFIANQRASLEYEDEDTRMRMDREFANRKSRVAMTFRRDAYAGRIQFSPKVAALQRLRDDMTGYVLKKTNHRWKVEDPKVSPDLGDAVLIGYAMIDMGSYVWIGG